MKELQNDEITQIKGGAAIMESIFVISIFTLTGVIMMKNLQTNMVSVSPEHKEDIESVSPLIGGIIFFPIAVYLALTV